MAKLAMKTRRLDVKKLLVSIIVCELVGVIGSMLTLPAISTWYYLLNKPSFNPPNWLFGPAWTVLYLLMGISLYMVWKGGLKTKMAKKSIAIFSIQLLLNLLWTLLFFGINSPLYAFAEIIILWLTILLTISYFYRISKKAAYLLIPYLVWVSFASVLNLYLWQLNQTPSYSIGTNCPNNNCNIPGASCGTVSPGYRDQCCTERNANTTHIMCVGSWKYVPEINQCVYECNTG